MPLYDKARTRALKDKMVAFFRSSHFWSAAAGFLLFLGQYPFSWLIAFYLGACLTAVNCQKLERLPFALPQFSQVRAPFIQGFTLGIGFFIPSLYWIAHSFAVYAYIDNIIVFFALSFIAVCGLSAIFSSFFGIGVLLSSFFPAGIARLLALVAFLSLADYSRGYIATGLPWNSFGYVWGASDALVQVAALIGSEGVGVVALLLAALSSCLVTHRRNKPALTLVATSFGVLMGLYFWGDARIERLSQEAEASHPHGFRLIQPNIPQDLKWNTQILSQNLGLMLQLSTIQRPDWVQHILWPETATPFALLESDQARNWLASVTPDGGTISVGSPRKGNDGDDQYFNALLSLDKDSNLLARYDKQHLVPFGEYTPFGVFALEAIIGKIGAYSPGEFPQPLLDTGYFPPALVAICYEVLFANEVLQRYRYHQDHTRPQWILTVSNDAWFGEISPAPYQHMAMAKWRSVELGLPMVRVNNTGISAVVDALGRVREQRGVGKIGVIDFKLPMRLSKPTLYTKIGSWGGILIMLILFFLALLCARFSQNK